MTVLSAPFALGNTYWMPKRVPERVRVPCPVCQGSKLVILLLGEDRVEVECEACGLGFEGPRGYVEEWRYEPAATEFTIEALDSYHDDTYRVRSTTGDVTEWTNLYPTREAALEVSRQQAAEAVERNMLSRQNTRSRAKQSTWKASYHLGQIADLERQIEWHRGKMKVLKGGAK